MEQIRPPQEILNPEYDNNIIVDDAILYSLMKIIKIKFHDKDDKDDDDTRTINVFTGITRVAIGTIPKNSKVQGSIDGEEVSLSLDDAKDGDYITFKVLIPEPILISGKILFMLLMGQKLRNAFLSLLSSDVGLYEATKVKYATSYTLFFNENTITSTDTHSIMPLL